MKKGFTMIEILIVIALLTIVAAAAAPIYGSLQVSSQLNENTSQIVQTLRYAREQSMAGYNNSRHGVKFEGDRYILYQGLSYDLRDAEYDREITISESLVISTTLPNDEVNFLPDLGRPDNTGTTTITHSSGGQRDIVINQVGLVEER